MLGIKRAIMVVVIGGLVLLVIRNWSGAAQGWLAPGQLQVAWQQDQSWAVGLLELRWVAGSEHLEVHHNQSVVWTSRPGRPWLAAARITSPVTPGQMRSGSSNGSLQHCDSQNWFEARVDTSGVALSGRLECGSASVPITLRISESGPDEVTFAWTLPPVPDNDGVSAGQRRREPAAIGQPRASGWVVTLDQRVDESTYAFGLGRLLDHWRLGSERYAALAEISEADAQGRFIALTSRFQAWHTDPGATVVLDRRRPGVDRLELWGGDVTDSNITNQVSLLTAESPLELVRGIRSEDPAMRPPPATEESDNLKQVTGQRVALGVNGQSRNNQNIGSAQWLYRAPDSPETRVDRLVWLGFIALVAPEWPFGGWSPADSSDVLRIHAGRLAQLHAALGPYRTQWEAGVTGGSPVIRPVWFEFPEEKGAWSAPRGQFMLGRDILVALPPETGRTVDVYLPEGIWTDIWTGVEWSSGGEAFTLTSSLDEPVALLRGAATRHEDLVQVASELSTTRILRGGARFSSTDAPLRLE